MAKKKKTKHNAVTGAVVLMIAAIVEKVVGAFFKIPLGRLIGGTGMGFFMSAYEIYAPVFAIAMAGLPVAISKMVASYAGEGRYRDVRKTLAVSKRAFLISGFTALLLIMVAAFPFAYFVSKEIDSIYSIMAIAPSIIFCCIVACYRGYNEGLRNMTPTATSHIIESIAKMVFGYFFAYFILQLAMAEFASNGTVFGHVIAETGKLGYEFAYEKALPYAAAGAVGGVTMGEISAAIYMHLKFKFSKDGITKTELANSPKPHPSKYTLKIMLAFAFPIVIGALIQSMTGLVDLITINLGLQKAMQLSVVTLKNSLSGVIDELSITKIPTFLFGCYKGYSFSFFTMIPAVTMVVGISVLPNLATAFKAKELKTAKINIESALRLSGIIAIFGGLLMSLLSENIMLLFYSGQTSEVAISSDLLKILAISGIFAGIAIPIISMLQAMDKQSLPVRNLCFGIVLKAGLNMFLVSIPQVNISGAAYSTLACYFLIFVLNLADLCKHSVMKLNIFSTLSKLFTSGLLSIFVGYIAKQLLINLSFSVKLENLIIIAVCTVVTLVFYIILLFAFKAFTQNDLKSLPNGEIIAKKLAKLHFLE